MMNASLSTFLSSRLSLSSTAYAAALHRQIAHRLTALARVFPTNAPLLRGIATCASSLASSDPSAWPKHVSSLHAAALAHVASCKTSCQPQPRPDLDALLSTVAALGIAAGEAAAALEGTDPPIVRTFDPYTLVREEVDAVRALSVEKFGAAPPTELRADLPPAHSCVAVPALLRHGIAELLKNAISAQIAVFSAGGVEDAQAIEVHATLAGTLTHFAVRNFAKAPPPSFFLQERGPFPYFSSPAPNAEDRGPTYQYSRDFGVPFSGAGVGLPLTHVYAALHGGGLSLRGLAGGGVEARFSLRCDGGGIGLGPHPFLLQ